MSSDIIDMTDQNSCVFKSCCLFGLWAKDQYLVFPDCAAASQWTKSEGDWCFSRMTMGIFWICFGNTGNAANTAKAQVRQNPSLWIRNRSKSDSFCS